MRTTEHAGGGGWAISYMLCSENIHLEFLYFYLITRNYFCILFKRNLEENFGHGQLLNCMA